MKKHMIKVRNINGLVESTYLGAYTAAANFAKFLVDRGGIYTLPLMPLLELVKAGLYWDKSSQPDFKDRTDNPLKIRLNRGFNGFKVVASSVAVGLALSGLMTIGFGMMIGIAYLNTARSLYKTIRSGLEGDSKKVANNLHKTLVSGAIATGFLLMTFFPPLAPIGMFLVLITAGHLILSLLPSVVADAMPEKQEARKSESLPSGQVGPNGSAVVKTLFLSEAPAQQQGNSGKSELRRRNSFSG